MKSLFFLFFKDFYLRILYCFVGFFIIWYFSFCFFEEFLFLFYKPLICNLKLDYNLLFIQPLEIFIVRIFGSCFISFLFILPYFFFQIFIFVLPSLFVVEIQKIFIYSIFIFIFFFFFLSQILFFVSNFLIFIFWVSGFSSFNFITVEYIPWITPYIKLIGFFLGGIFFLLQFPFFLFLNSEKHYFKLGFLFSFKKIIYFFFILIATVVSPPDVFSQVFIFFLLALCFETTFFIEIFIFKSKLFNKQNDKNIVER